MHYDIYAQLARPHQAELLREAEQHRLALVANGGSVKRRGRLLSFLAQFRRRRLQQRPVPAV
jgi:hypothetical protein